MLKVGIVGSTGYIGKNLTSYLNGSNYDIVEINRLGSKGALKLDLLEYLSFDYDVFNELDYIVYSAAISNPDRCKNEYKLAYKINVEATKYIINQAINRDCRVIFFSSDAVYGKKLNEVFDEQSVLKPSTPYGIMKKEVEDTFYSHPNFKSLRLSYVMSREDKFMRYVDSCIHNNVELELFHPFYRNIVMLHELLELTVYILTYWIEIEEKVINVSGKELISKVRLIDEYSRFIGKKIDYTIVEPEREFFNNRPQVVELRSKTMDRIMKNYSSSFYERMCTELNKITI